MQALNGTMPRPASESVSRKQLTKMLAQVSTWSRVQVPPCYLPPAGFSFQPVPCLQCASSLCCCLVLPYTARSSLWLNLVDSQLPRAQLV